MRYFLFCLLCISIPLALAQENNEAKPVDALAYQGRSILVLFDDGHYLIHTLPDELDVFRINTVTLQADESILIAYTEDYGGSNLYLQMNAYTGSTEDVPVACGLVPFASPENASWLLIEANGQSQICNTATDERRELPSDIGWMSFENYDEAYRLSPNGEWLILFAWVENAPYEDYTVYSYEIPSSQLRYLGYIEGEGAMYPPQLSHWVSDNLGSVYYSIDGEWSSDPFYVFDASRENSLELAVRGWVYGFYDNPPHYEYLQTPEFVIFETGSQVDSMFCSLMIYDAQGLRNFDLGYACGSMGYWQDFCTVLYPVEGGYIYLRFDSADSPTSTITFIDYLTGAKRDILSGEIEAVTSVVDDTVYYLSDNNGHIDYPIGRGCPMADSFTLEQTASFTQASVNWR